MMEQTAESLYSLLIGISKDVGEIKADVKNTNSDIKDVQSKVEQYNSESAVADEKVATKLEEYFEYAKNRQDVIKDELEVQIGNVRTEVANHDGRLKALEEKPKNRLWDVFVQFKGLIVTAILVALAGFCMNSITNIVKASQPVQQATNGGN